MERLDTSHMTDHVREAFETFFGKRVEPETEQDIWAEIIHEEAWKAWQQSRREALREAIDMLENDVCNELSVPEEWQAIRKCVELLRAAAEEVGRE